MLVEVKSIAKAYSVGLFKQHTQFVLENLSFKLESDVCTALIGRSGAGKSTLARILSGLEEPDQGQVLFKGQNLHQALHKKDQKIRGKIQIVFQNSFNSLNPRWTISKSVAEPLLNLGLFGDKLESKIEFLLAQVELAGLGSRLPCELSGGQLQRACLARALAPEPELLILDEAFSGLDVPIQARMVNLLHNLKQKHKLSCLLITHDVHLANVMCQKIMLLDQGQIGLTVGSLAELYASSHPLGMEFGASSLAFA